MAETKLRVAIRVRPLRSEEGACAWRIEDENVYQADCEEVVGRTAFRYDAVYGENSATKDGGAAQGMSENGGQGSAEAKERSGKKKVCRFASHVWIEV